MNKNFQGDNEKLIVVLFAFMVVIVLILNTVFPELPLPNRSRSQVFISLILASAVHDLIKFFQFYLFSKMNKLIKIKGELCDTKEIVHAKNTRFTATYKYEYEDKSGQTESYEKLFPPINSHVTLYYDPVKDSAYINYFSFYLFRFAIVFLIGLAFFIA